MLVVIPWVVQTELQLITKFKENQSIRIELKLKQFRPLAHMKKQNWNIKEVKYSPPVIGDREGNDHDKHVFFFHLIGDAEQDMFFVCCFAKSSKKTHIFWLLNHDSYDQFLGIFFLHHPLWGKLEDFRRTY